MTTETEAMFGYQAALEPSSGSKGLYVPAPQRFYRALSRVNQNLWIGVRTVMGAEQDQLPRNKYFGNTSREACSSTCSGWLARTWLKRGNLAGPTLSTQETCDSECVPWVTWEPWPACGAEEWGFEQTDTVRSCPQTQSPLKLSAS